MKQIKHFF